MTFNQPDLHPDITALCCRPYKYDSNHFNSLPVKPNDPLFSSMAKLIMSGIHGRTLNVIRDMYSKMKACVKTK